MSLFFNLLASVISQPDNLLPTVTVRPNVLCADSALNALITESMTRHTLTFPWSLSFPFSQMLLCRETFKRRREHVQYRREILTVDSGDTIALDWLIGQDELPLDAPLAVISPTLVGKGDDVREYAEELAKQDFRVVVVQRRGHSGLPLASASWNLMGNTADLRIAVNEVHTRYPNAQITLMGVSAGCGIVVRYLSEEAGNPQAAPITGAVLICPGWDLNVTWQHMSLLISLYFALQIRTKVLWKHRAVLSHAPAFWRAMLFGNTMSKLYPLLYGVAGFEDYETFATASDPAANMHRVTRVPIVALNNKDDYACSWKSVREYTILSQPNTALVSLSCGGSHLGGYTSWNTQQGGTVNWGAENAARFLKALVVRHKRHTASTSV